MVDGLTNDGAALNANNSRSVIPGVGAVALGVLALAIAATEYLVFADISRPTDSGNSILGLSTGTAAYVAGYAAAGVILIALGCLKIHRARRGG